MGPRVRGEGWSVERVGIIYGDVFAGDDEPLLVEADQAGQVPGTRRGTDYREHSRDGQPVLAPIAAADGDGLEPVTAVEGLDLVLAAQHDQA